MGSYNILYITYKGEKKSIDEWCRLLNINKGTFKYRIKTGMSIDKAIETPIKNRVVNGQTKNPLYHTWEGMKSRCYNVNDSNYKYYGGRGIKICDEWLKDPSVFMKDMGPKPSSTHTIDRINNNANYYPSNCRWATKEEQQNNTSISKKIEYKGELYSLRKLSRILGMSQTNLRERINKWGEKKAITEPINKNYQHVKKKT